LETAILGALSILFFIWGMYAYLGYKKDKGEVKKRYKNWFQVEGRKSFVVVLGDRYDQTDMAKRMKRKLIQANIPLQPSEFLSILLVIGIFIYVVLMIIFKLPNIASLVIGVIAGVLSYFIIFAVRKNK